MAILEVKQLTKIYGNQYSPQEVLHDINLSVEKVNLSQLWGLLVREKQHY